ARTKVQVQQTVQLLPLGVNHQIDVLRSARGSVICRRQRSGQHEGYPRFGEASCNEGKEFPVPETKGAPATRRGEPHVPKGKARSAAAAHRQLSAVGPAADWAGEKACRSKVSDHFGNVSFNPSSY